MGIHQTMEKDKATAINNDMVRCRMTIKELYEEAKAMGKEEYEMVTVEMGKDRTYRWYEVKPRYGENVDFVYMEIGGEVAE